MNCKPGDLAVITRTLGVPHGEHLLGIVLRVSSVDGHSVAHGPYWRVEPGAFVPRNFPLVAMRGVPIEFCVDAILTPLRGAPGTDEMLRIAGNPLSSTATTKE